MKTELKLLIFAGALLAQTNVSYALPLLAESASINTANALTLYPDHKDSNKFYFMPNSSTFVRDQASGLPAFGLTFWGLSNGGPLADAGAYMTFAMRLHSNDSQKEALEQAIKSGKNIAVMPVQSSMIGLNSTSTDKPPLSKLFDEFNYAVKGGKFEDEIGVNALMTGVGAKVFRKAINNPMLIKFDYCYIVTGLGPNFDADFTINWKRVYEDFETHASGGGLFFSWEIDAQIEKLKDDKIIDIHVNGGDATDEEYVKAAVREVVAKFFVPELDAKPVAGQSGGGFSFSRFSLKYTNKEELKTISWKYQKHNNIDREFCIPVSLTEISKYKDQLVQDADQ